MAKKSILVVFLFIFLNFGLIITVPILSFTSSLSNYDTYDDIVYIKHLPDNGSEIQDLTIFNEIGHVIIRYFEPNPTIDYGIMIEANFEMSGNNLANKDYSDFFIILNESEGSRYNFTMKFISEVNKLEVLSLIKNITIFVNLRADIIFDITVNTIDGDIDVTIPYMASIRNLTTNTTNGDLFYDFSHSIFGGNIAGITNNGDLKLKVNNIQCIRNMIWNFTIQNGDMVAEINQYIEMGANITGTIFITGHLKLTYIENHSNVGALFSFPLLDPPSPLPPMVGFIPRLLNPAGHYYESTDYPAKVNYNLLFNLILRYDVNLVSD